MPFAINYLPRTAAKAVAMQPFFCNLPTDPVGIAEAYDRLMCGAQQDVDADPADLTGYPLWNQLEGIDAASLSETIEALARKIENLQRKGFQ